MGGTYASDEVFAMVRHCDVVALLVGEVDCLLLDELVHFRVILRAGVERRESDDHLVGQDSQGPPVHRERMAALDQNFWSQVVGSSTERISLSVALDDLSETEISQADIAILVHEDVLWLEITVDDVFLVEMAESHGDLNGVEPSAFFGEASHLAEVHKQLSATHEAHHKEDLLLRLEHVAHANQEGVVSLEEDVLLQAC